MVLDDASSFRVVVPTGAVSAIGGKEVRTLFSQCWGNWAGPPDALFFDPLRGHLADEFMSMGEHDDVNMKPIPAESPQMKGRIERAIDFWKDMFSKV